MPKDLSAQPQPPGSQKARIALKVDGRVAQVIIRVFLRPNAARDRARRRPPDHPRAVSSIGLSALPRDPRGSALHGAPVASVGLRTGSDILVYAHGKFRLRIPTSRAPTPTTKARIPAKATTFPLGFGRCRRRCPSRLTICQPPAHHVRRGRPCLRSL